MLDVALDGRWVMTLTTVILCKMISAKFRSRKTTLNLPRARFNIEHWKSANQQSVSADWVQKLFCFVGEAFFCAIFLIIYFYPSNSQNRILLFGVLWRLGGPRCRLYAGVPTHPRSAHPQMAVARVTHRNQPRYELEFNLQCLDCLHNLLPLSCVVEASSALTR